MRSFADVANLCFVTVLEWARHGDHILHSNLKPPTRKLLRDTKRTFCVERFMVLTSASVEY